MFQVLSERAAQHNAAAPSRVDLPIGVDRPSSAVCPSCLHKTGPHAMQTQILISCSALVPVTLSDCGRETAHARQPDLKWHCV